MAAVVPIRFPQSRIRQARPSVEALEDRILPALTTLFQAGTLTIQGDADPDTVRIAQDDSGDITLNGQAIGDGPTVGNTLGIQVFAGDGDDVGDCAGLTAQIACLIQGGG